MAAITSRSIVFLTPQRAHSCSSHQFWKCLYSGLLLLQQLKHKTHSGPRSLTIKKNKSVMTIYDNHRTPKHGSIHNKLWHWMDIFRSSAKANWGGSSSTAPFGSRIHPSEAWKSPSKQKSRVQANRNQMLAPGPITIQSRSNHLCY